MRFKIVLLIAFVALAAGAGGYYLGTRNRPTGAVENETARDTPPAAKPAAAAEPMEVALDGVPRHAVGFTSLKVSRVWDHDAVRLLHDWLRPDGEPSRFAARAFALPPAELDRFTGVWEWVPSSDSTSSRPPFQYVLATSRTPFDRAALRKRLALDEPRANPHVVPFPIDRTTIFLNLSGDPHSRPDMPPSVERLVRYDNDGPLAPALDAAKSHAFVLSFNGERLAEVARLFDLEPALLDGLKAVKLITLSADLEDALVVRVNLTFANRAAAEAAKPALTALFATWAAELEAEQQQAIAAGQGNDPESAVYGWAAGALRQLRPEVAGNALADTALVATVRLPFDGSFRAAVAALPVVLNWDTDYRSAQNNLKQIALGFHSYESANGQLPNGAFPNGQPNAEPWSWRVQLLPYVEYQNLYSQLQFQHPWNHPTNLKVLEAAEMPKVFEHPGRSAPKGHTYFRVFTYPKGAKGGQRPIFDEGSQGTRFADITDGMSNTILIVEARDAVPWYKPDLLPYDGVQPLPPLGSPTGRKFLAAMTDGSVRTFPQKMPEGKLRAYITRAGGEVIEEQPKR